MSWASALCALYDANARRAGEAENWMGKVLTLIPLGYDTMKAQIEIAIDQDGSFVGARALGKDEAETIVPYPESRTSGVKALPLCDSLAYVAGDFLERVTLYFDDKVTDKQRKRKLDDIEKSFPAYLLGLEAWCSSQYAHPKVAAIYRYVSKKIVIGDLLQSGVLAPDGNGILSDKKKIQGVRIEKTFVRFRVYTPDALQPETLGSAGDSSAVWLDKSVQKSFIAYYLSTAPKADIGYLTGELMLPVKTNPAKLRGEWDTKAKLISSNDDINFTYRGRFYTKDKETGYNEALSIGYETAQKVHNALKWIVRRQGYSRDGVCMVAWESVLKEMPAFHSSSVEILEGAEDTEAEAENMTEMLFDEESDAASASMTNYLSARDFNSAIDGYAVKLDDTSGMVLMALDSATPGRLALTYYRELPSARYLANIRAWHMRGCWRQEYFRNKQLLRYEGMASISETAAAIYGTEQHKRLTLRENGDGKKMMLASAFERLRPCIIDCAAVPLDMVLSAVQKASNPLVYESSFNYQRVLHIACSLVKCCYWEKGVIFEMELDTKCPDRSYLYGRLLAVAEKVERCTYEKDETRTTNAERYMRQFSRTPFRSWEIIRRNIGVYLNQLRPGSREYYKNLFGEIAGLFAAGDFESKEPLDGKYLLGYDCQRAALKFHNSDAPVPKNEADDSETEES